MALARKLGYDGDTNPELVLHFLQTQKALDILKASIMFLDWDYANPMPWVPIQDSFSSHPFLPNTFTKAVQYGKFEKVPVIIGACKDEGLILTAPFYKARKRWDVLRKNWEEWAPLLFFNRERELITDDDKAIAKEIGDFYFGKEVDISMLEGKDETL